MESNKAKIPRRHMLNALSAVPLAAFVPVLAEARTRHFLYFSCSEDNDLFRVAKASGNACLHSDHAEEVVDQAPRGSGLLILGDSYPHQKTHIEAGIYQTAASKKLRLYVEFPSAVPDITVGAPECVAHGKNHNIIDRAVVDTTAFAPELKQMRILALHNCVYLPVSTQKSELVLARVEGFNTAVYGFPQNGVHPILFRHPNRDILVATTKLNEFVTGRYAPPAAWPYIWRWIFE